MDLEPEALFPVYLDLRGRRVVVVGGGEVGERKAEALLRAGARVTVVAPAATPGLRARAEAGELRWRARPYRVGDLEGAALAFAAVDDAAVGAEVAADARAAGVPVNVAGQPELGDFQVPATARRGRLQIAVSTGGASPAWARRIREDLEARFGPEYGRLFDALAAARGELLAAVTDPAERRRALASLA
ncbi:MAG: precorrin-2 dehydrogenase/sirohydrochlorin ferrochelatase family protein, partial [Deferrisomatales bacterium]